MYLMENYRDNIPFNKQYDEIHNFLQKNADHGYNEHFHWGRFDWMMAHSYLDVEMLSKIGLFRDESGEIVGLVAYDTSFDDRWYILHSISVESLLRQMIEYVVENEAGAVTIKANINDTVLCEMLANTGFEKQYAESILGIDLSSNLSFKLPQGFSFNDVESEIDDWQHQLVIYHGFDHEGIPQKPNEEVAKAGEHLKTSEYIKVFAIKDKEYVAHCGIWYNIGDTAYIEPVVTIPEHRRKGIGKAVVYEAINRAKERGAKRAIVLSDQKFYINIGMTKSSEIVTWVKNFT